MAACPFAGQNFPLGMGAFIKRFGMLPSNCRPWKSWLKGKSRCPSIVKSTFGGQRKAQVCVSVHPRNTSFLKVSIKLRSTLRFRPWKWLVQAPSVMDPWDWQRLLENMQQLNFLSHNQVFNSSFLICSSYFPDLADIYGDCGMSSLTRGLWLLHSLDFQFKDKWVNWLGLLWL